MLSLWSLHVHFTANGSHRTQAVQESEDDVHQGGEYCFELEQILFFLLLIIKIIIILYRYKIIIILIRWYIIVSALIIKPHSPFLIFDDICEVHRKVGESSRGWKIEFRLNQQWIENYGNPLGISLKHSARIAKAAFSQVTVRQVKSLSLLSCLQGSTNRWILGSPCRESGIVAKIPHFFARILFEELML